MAQEPAERTFASQPLILVADDESRITRLVSLLLSDEGFRVEVARSGEDALAKAAELRPDLILLDIMMPGLDGIETMRLLRERDGTPIILLTARGSIPQRVEGLDHGADDYISKPFHPDELAARVRAVLRRADDGDQGRLIAFDDVEIDLEKRLVTRAGDRVDLSRTEWLLLEQLASHAGRVVLHAELLSNIWGAEYRDDLQYLRVWVSRVRRKLGAKPGESGRIKTVPGIGYCLMVDDGGATPSVGEAADTGVLVETRV